MNLLKTGIRYILYILNAIDEHSLHPPFIFNFYTRVIKKKAVGNPASFQKIEQLRHHLLGSKKYISISDLGAGSLINHHRERRINEIAKYSLSTRKFSAFLHHLIRHYQCNHIIELGTSFGINTLYMATAHPQTTVVTFEGCAEIAAIAKGNFKAFGPANIQTIQGNIDMALPEYLERHDSVDLVYFDANHQYGPTLQYFHQCLKKIKSTSVFIFDDIHWSSEMEEAWAAIKNHPEVTLTADLFDAGIVFFRKGVEKKHYILEF